jgi:NAD(P)-dependent dehydrogenase (short-subunit alcohol dehydrogenase family)
MNNVWLITGARRGFGRAFAEEAVRHGDYVIAGLRSWDKKDPFFQNDHVLPVSMEVTSQEAVRAAVDKGLETWGRIDVLVNNAGFGMSGAFEETADSDLRNLMETDYYGVVNVIRAVLPHMRQAGKGKILNISSQGGLMGFTGSSAYCSAKFAVVGLSQVLRSELSDFGIEVCAVCPGSFRTDFRDPSSLHEPSLSLAAYEGSRARSAARFLHDNTHNQAGDPAKAAAFVYAMVSRGNLPSRLLIGRDCCRQVKEDLRKQLEEIESYEEMSSQTDFPNP